MPLPTPTGGESREAFVSRCMGDPIMRGEFPNSDQRYAVCRRQFDRPSSKSEAEYTNSEMGDDPLALLEDDLDD